MMKTAWRYLVSIAAAAACTAALAGTVVYYHNDIAGTPIAATNESGALLWRESYRPYGERLTNSPASSGNDLWFTSRRQDVETGLVYMGARYYDPVVGRFISTDPMGFDEANVHSFNRYAYANNNPLKYKDPDGRAAETIWDLASFAISVGMFKNDPTLANFLGAAVDGVAVAIPFVPGGVGAVRAMGKAGAEAVEHVRLPALDATGKVHGDIPGHIPPNAKREELEELSVDLRKSIEFRKGEATRLGEDGPHRNRIREEENFLRQIDKALGGP
jgi:RHS repeat-associated protein